MISHISLGANNLEQARSFYGRLISLLGGKEIYASGRVVFWEFLNSSTKLALTVPFNNESANFGDGTMVALKAENKKEVDRILWLLAWVL
ncbi:hypothetical protein [Microbulbifer sp. DLAB2-AA]|uniref:hypothetical protein n=1 Tax=Microbulbifer sp. DLAB2-AA TaxID=3243394 RepID=UPI004039B9E5